ncbi:MAG: shikimate kinase [Bacteroidetes bacterium]|nr:MAG: shikimate kinase [Bacteroidota bacterium]
MNFFLITGPPAVGKMTVGQALADRLGYPLFHNHHSIEFALQFFDWGSPEFKAINEGVRQLMFRTASESRNLKGLIFTLVWAFDLKEDWDYVAAIRTRFEAQGWVFHIVELYADLDTRLARNDRPDRLAAKPSKRDPEMRRQGLMGMEERFQMSSGPGQIQASHYLRIDNTHLPPEAAAAEIIRYFNLKTS